MGKAREDMPCTSSYKGREEGEVVNIRGQVAQEKGGHPLRRGARQVGKSSVGL